jgi:GAF domain-containing protein
MSDCNKSKDGPQDSSDSAGVTFAFLNEIGNRILAANALSLILGRIADFAVSVMDCDSCFIYLLEEGELVLAASKNPHPELVDRLRLLVGEGITGWVAEQREPVVVTEKAYQDKRFRFFHELPEDRYEAFLSVPILFRGSKLVGVINLQNQKPHKYSQRDIHLVSAIGFLVGAAIEMMRLETKISELSDALLTRKLMERAKGILQREFQLSEEQSYFALQKQSRKLRKSMKEVAEAIILNEDIRREPRGTDNRADGDRSTEQPP